MKKKKLEEGDWHLTIIPVKRDKFFISFRQEPGLDIVFTNAWIQENGVDYEKDISVSNYQFERDAFWACYNKTLEYMQNYGINNVRSDVFPETFLNSYMLNHINGLINFKVLCSYTELKCSRCLRIGHSADLCYAESNYEGNLIEESSDSSSSSSS